MSQSIASNATEPFEAASRKAFEDTIANFREQGLDSIKHTKAPAYITAALEALQKGAKSIVEEYNVNVTWVSQLDISIFGKCTGCWRTSCCRRAAEYMMGNTNMANCMDTIIAKKAPYMPTFGIITAANFSDNTTNYTATAYNNATLNSSATAMDEAITYMQEKLKNGRPVLIGVHYTGATYDPPNNKTNKATRHFMVVVGYQKKGDTIKILFYDPGRNKDNKNEATSSNNVLEVNREKGCIQGIYRNSTYTLTEVIKTN
jgi:hypothetical protein